MHLVLHWGAGFRKDFQQIGLALSRMPQRTVCIGVTATLPTGDAAALAQSLGLAAGSFFFLDVQIFDMTFVSNSEPLHMDLAAPFFLTSTGLSKDTERHRSFVILSA